MALMLPIQGGSSAPGRAILLMLIGGMLLTVNDALMKWLAGGFPVGELLFVRSVFSFVAIAVLVRFHGGLPSLRIKSPRVHLFRSLLVLAGTFMFVNGLRYLPLADAIAIVFAGPLFITALAPLVIGEAVGWRRWSAVVVGFIGVLIIVRPGTEAMQWAVIFPIGAAMTGAFRDLITRSASATEHSNAMLMTGTAASAIGGLCTLPFGWVPISLHDLGLMALSGFLMAIAHFMMIESFRYGEAGLVAPFKYSNMVYAVLLGFFIWGDLPDALTWTGTAILISSGVYILHRERRLGGKPPQIGGPGGAGA